MTADDFRDVSNRYMSTVGGSDQARSLRLLEVLDLILSEGLVPYNSFVETLRLQIQMSK